jgi:hypothetical protein
VRGDALRHRAAPENRGLAGAEDARLLGADRLDRVAQVFAMVDADRDDRRSVGVQDIHGVEPAAHPDLEHGDVHARSDEYQEGRERIPFEECERDVAARGIDLGKSLKQGFVRDLAPVHADPLVVAHEMRRRKKARLVAGRRQDCVEVGGDRALAVGAADCQDSCGKCQSKPLPGFADTG